MAMAMASLPDSAPRYNRSAPWAWAPLAASQIRIGLDEVLCPQPTRRKRARRELTDSEKAEQLGASLVVELILNAPFLP